MATTNALYWPGTREERQALLAAIKPYCTCVRDEDDVLMEVCPPHHMLVHDQRAIQGLLVFRRLADRLRREEGLAPTS